MDSHIEISFDVNPSQLETITLRANENGFDSVQAYVKVVSLKTQAFTLSPDRGYEAPASDTISFNVTKAQEEIINTNVDQSECEDRNAYLKYVSLHGVVTSVVEVRSTGTLDAMLARIAKSKS